MNLLVLKNIRTKMSWTNETQIRLEEFILLEQSLLNDFLQLKRPQGGSFHKRQNLNKSDMNNHNKQVE